MAYSDFTGASLLSTSFIEANLHGAHLDADDYDSEFNAVLSSLDKLSQAWIVMPNFSCADLSAAEFGHRALFPGVADAPRTYSLSEHTKPDWYGGMSGSLEAEYAKNKEDHEVSFPAVPIRPPVLQSEFV